MPAAAPVHAWEYAASPWERIHIGHAGPMNGKEAVKKLTGGELQAKLCNLLLRYRITPHFRTGLAPCELLLKRRIRSTLSQLKPCVGQKMQARQMAAAVEG